MNSTEITFLMERQGVVDAVVRYATGIDMHEWVTYRSCFTDVCHRSHGRGYKRNANRHVLNRLKA